MKYKVTITREVEANSQGHAEEITRGFLQGKGIVEGKHYQSIQAKDYEEHKKM